ncbi:PPOX class probable FMN-dependent enzyme [Paenibacillus forsythiae]|uniref:PPOX class probable FMN-dependent enzyme n=1 Tax=Paenibacillus forsythiae TaxID=365616 RepID=A0ABU3H2B9_9BACL|nr:MSMEG_1061 family FMN-dependent PPOX-type flavoprotein [Paenibacillus forsythiae]MDT3424963.1 PPOX class probable FMN-dependent enzyme [Paenibacillus forsythiae]
MELLWKDGIITSKEELIEMVGVPHETVVNKNISFIDSHIENYLAMSPLFFISTSSLNGRADVSPRGDGPGFVKMMDEKRLIFPDRPGNRRLDSLNNILENPQVGMIFIIPGLNDVLRINGRAWITRNEELLKQFQWKGKTTGMGVIVEVEECFIHCPRAFNQAGIWKPEKWPPKDQLPNLLDMWKAHVALNGISAE